VDTRRRTLTEYRRCEPQRLNQVNSARAAWVQQHAPHFITNTFATHAGEVMSNAAHGRFGTGVDGESKSCRKARRTQCAQAIFMKAIVSAADRTQYASGKIRATANVINDFTGLRIFKESIDSEISTRRIFTIIAEAHRVGATTIHVHPISAKCCNLYRTSSVTHQHHSKGFTHTHGAGENLPNFSGNCAGCHVKVRGLMTKNGIANAASREERSVPCFTQLACHPGSRDAWL
jgi:hypothetical protein